MTDNGWMLLVKKKSVTYYCYSGQKKTLKRDYISRNIPSRGNKPFSASRGSSNPKKSSLAPKLSAPNADGYKVVCYYTNWSQYR
jgi:hypothetical protein